MEQEREIEDRVRLRTEKGDFFEQLLLLSRNASADVHEDFVRELTDVSVKLRRLFEKEDLICRVSQPASDFWPSMRGKRFAFIDGGIARIDIPSAAPLGIRVGSYIVAPGDESDARESFNVELCLVDELYSVTSRTYESAFEDLDKLTDAARIVSEASAAYHMVARERTLDAVFLHGPLVNPVAPYGTPGFPPFTEETARRLLDGEQEEFAEDEDRHFVRCYRQILERLAEQRIPIVGVVERSRARSAFVVRGYLDELAAQNRVSTDVKNEFLDKLDEYRLTDAALFSVILATGEYSKPQLVDRQMPENKWPDEWRKDIRRYQGALTSYMKSNDASEPFRLELLEKQGSSVFAIEVMMYTARLLPNYGFPVGLDIVDKFAKVPAWMSRGIQVQHAVILLKNALKSGNQNTVDYAKRVLAARGRDWLFRPKA